MARSLEGQRAKHTSVDTFDELRLDQHLEPVQTAFLRRALLITQGEGLGSLHHHLLLCTKCGAALSRKPCTRLPSARHFSHA
jgi:hypothetical protein